MKPKWQTHMHINMSNQHSLLLRDNKLGVQCEVYTKAKNGYTYGKGRCYYFIDGDKRQFRTEEALIKALEASDVV
jgi:hypothetical protein